MPNENNRLTRFFAMNEAKEENRLLRIPILDPILMILRKRTVIGPIFAVLIGLLFTVIPQLNYIEEELFFLFAFVFAPALGGMQFALDLISAWRTDGVPTSDKTPKDQFADLIELIGEEALEAFLNNYRTQRTVTQLNSITK